MPKIRSVSGLRKYFSSLSQQELVGELLKLINLYPQVNEYYQFRVNPQKSQEIIDSYKEGIKQEFFPKHGFGEARLSVATKIIRDYRKISTNPEGLIDLMLYYAEQGVRYTQAYGDIDESFYESMENMFDNVLSLAQENNLLEKFKERALKIRRATDGMGWGFGDNIEYIYDSYFKTPK